MGRDVGVPRRHVAFSRAWLEPPFTDSYVDVVNLAVQLRRSKREQILRVELVGDAGERGGEILAHSNLGVATACLLGHPCKAGIRQICQHHRFQTAASDAW